MKMLILLSLLMMSFKSMAHTCLISLYDPYNRPYIYFPTENDPNCSNAANQCYGSIQSMRLDPRVYRCYTISMKEDAVNTRVIPQVPQRSVVEKSDHQRVVLNGETVIFEGKHWIVSSIEERVLSIKEKNGKDKKNVSRQAVAVTRGCYKGICTKTSILSKRTQTYLSVEGIEYNGRFLLQDVNSKEFPVSEEYQNIAVTEGCVAPFTGQVCVDNKVIDQRNRYFTVVGIQTDGSVVVKDESGKLYFNQNPAIFVITR